MHSFISIAPPAIQTQEYLHPSPVALSDGVVPETGLMVVKSSYLMAQTCLRWSPWLPWPLHRMRGEVSS